MISVPRVKEREPDFAGLGRTIRGYGYNSVTLAEVLGVSQPTAMRKLKEPEHLTLADLKRIAQRGHIPLDELRDRIRW